MCSCLCVRRSSVLRARVELEFTGYATTDFAEFTGVGVFFTQNQSCVCPPGTCKPLPVEAWMNHKHGRASTMWIEVPSVRCVVRGCVWVDGCCTLCRDGRATTQWRWHGHRLPVLPFVVHVCRGLQSEVRQRQQRPQHVQLRRLVELCQLYVPSRACAVPVAVRTRFCCGAAPLLFVRPCCAAGPAGWYCEDGYAFVCPAGTYELNSTCVTCPAGHRCSRGYDHGPCSPGFYMPPPGSYNNVTATVVVDANATSLTYPTDVCIPCDVGWYNNATGATVRKPCTPLVRTRLAWLLGIEACVNGRVGVCVLRHRHVFLARLAPAPTTAAQAVSRVDQERRPRQAAAAALCLERGALCKISLHFFRRQGVPHCANALDTFQGVASKQWPPQEQYTTLAIHNSSHDKSVLHNRACWTATESTPTTKQATDNGARTTAAQCATEHTHTYTQKGREV